MKKIYTLLLAAVLFLSSCDILQQILEQGAKSQSLTNSEIIEGLKKALSTGTESSTNLLHARDGFLKDQAVKILLPPEAEVITQNLAKIPGVGQQTIDDLILKINRSAEDAAVEAKPIFIDAIKNMTIQDGMNILKGKSGNTSSFDSTAATVYLKGRTYQNLKAAFAPKINASLNKKLVGNISTSSAWSNVINLYNKIAPLIGKQKINPDLGAYVTEKALNGVFLKIGVEEKKIRKNPMSYASDIIKKVFGSVYKK